MTNGVGRKDDDGKVDLTLVTEGFPRALIAVAELSMFGAKKYGRHNWHHVADGYNRYTKAMLRHYLDEAVTEVDNDSELQHIVHTVWNALARLELHLRGQSTSARELLRQEVRLEMERGAVECVQRERERDLRQLTE